MILATQTIHESALSRQTIRDVAAVKNRVAKCGQEFENMKNRLKNATKQQLLDYADSIAPQYHFPPCDRVCRRSKEALVCWFCEHVPTIAIEQPRRIELPPIDVRFPVLLLPGIGGTM
jgi:hypothetical protein